MEFNRKGIKGSAKRWIYWIMNFTILFHLIGGLNFHVQFSLHSHNTQDFFIFQGENSSAHLYRDNETVSLYLREDKDFEVYQMHILNELKFSWIGFKVNGIDMKKIKSTGVTSMGELNEFTFLSPVVDLQADALMNLCSPNVKCQWNNNGRWSYAISELQECELWLYCWSYTNNCHGSRIKIPLIIERLFGQQIENDFEESDYETMENLETHV